MTAMRLKRYPSPSGGFALGKMGAGAMMLKQGATARDYVQDGLVAMWDGEWNAGPGVHDATATTWKDLTNNGCDAALSGTYSWGNMSWNVASVSGRGLATWNITGPFTDQTIEVVIRPTAVKAWSRITSNWRAVPSVIVKAGALWVYGWSTDSGIAVQGYQEKALHSHQIVYRYNDSFAYYVDSDLKWNRSASGGALGGTCYFANTSTFGAEDGLDAEYHSIRIYSRALTAAEIAANYAVDKARFSLPDAT